MFLWEHRNHAKSSQDGVINLYCDTLIQVVIDFNNLEKKTLL